MCAPVGAADPVALHQLDRLGPVQRVQVVQQPVGVRGDPHHPLLQVALEDREVAALAAAVGGDLLVGQHRAQARAPVDRRLGDVRQPVVVDDRAPLDVGQLGPRRGRPGSAALPASNSAISSAIGRALLGLRVVPGVEDLQEDPLGPAVVVGVGGRDRAPVVVAQAQPAQLRPVPLDVRLGGDPRVRAGLHRVLLGGQAERVEAHRVQHVVAGHPLVAGEDSRCRCSPAGGRRAGPRRTGTGTCPARTASARRRAGGRGRPAAPVGFGAWNVPSPSQ